MSSSENKELSGPDLKSGVSFQSLQDNAPLLGFLGPGLVAATGHHRNGVLLTPVTADAIAELVATGRVPDEIAAFAPDRFPVEVTRS